MPARISCNRVKPLSARCGKPARYRARLVVAGFEVWAFACDDCRAKTPPDATHWTDLASLPKSIARGAPRDPFPR